MSFIRQVLLTLLIISGVTVLSTDPLHAQEAEKESHPKGQIMELFLRSWSPTYGIGPAMPGDYHKKVWGWADDYTSKVDDLIDQIGENPHAIDRGAEFGDMFTYNLEDALDMLMAYGIFGDSSTCGALNIVGICIKFEFPDIEVDAYWEYFVPFQKVETHDVPWSSGYYPKQMVELEMDLSQEIKLFGAEATAPMGWDLMSMNWKGKAPEEVNKEAMDQSDNFDKDQIWRNPLPPQGGYRYAEYHVVPTYFEDAFGSLWSDIWCHDQQQEPFYFGEFAEGIFARTFAWMSYILFPMDTPPVMVPANCMMNNFAPKGQTPMDIHPIDLSITGPPGMPWCLPPNKSDTRGPAWNVVKTNYPAQAFEVAVRRGLMAGKMLAVRGGMLHQLTPKESGNIKRDKLQILRNSRFPKKCSPWQDQDDFTTDWSGADFGEANHNDPDEQGHWNVAAHWRYIRCCPGSDWTAFGPNPQQRS